MRFFAPDLNAQREIARQSPDQFKITGLVPALFQETDFVIFFKSFQQDDAASIFIAKKRDGVISFLFQVAEANDVPKSLHRVQVQLVREKPGSAMLRGSYPQSVQRRGVKASQKHVRPRKITSRCFTRMEGLVIILKFFELLS